MLYKYYKKYYNPANVTCWEFLLFLFLFENLISCTHTFLERCVTGLQNDMLSPQATLICRHVTGKHRMSFQAVGRVASEAKYLVWQLRRLHNLFCCVCIWSYRKQLQTPSSSSGYFWSYLYVFSGCIFPRFDPHPPHSPLGGGSSSFYPSASLILFWKRFLFWRRYRKLRGVATAAW